MTKPQLLKITDEAKQRIDTLLRSAPKGTLAIRVRIGTTGCSGYKYEIEYADEQRSFEESVDAGGGNLVFIAPDALMHLIGATMFYRQNKTSSGFDFENPNEKGRCGCGESFIV